MNDLDKLSVMEAVAICTLKPKETAKAVAVVVVVALMVEEAVATVTRTTPTITDSFNELPLRYKWAKAK